MKSPIQQDPATSDKTHTASSRNNSASKTIQYLIEYIDVFCNESLEGILVLDHQSRILYLNPAANAIFSSSNQDCLGQFIWHAFPDLNQIFRDQIDTVLDNSGVNLIKTAYPSLHKSLAMRIKKTALNIFIFVQEISDNSDAAHQDSIQTSLLDSIVANMFDGVIVIDQEGMILSFNPAAENMTGFTANELMGQSVNLLMDPDMAQKHDAYLALFKSTGQHDVVGKKRPICLHRKDKSNIPVEIALTKIELEGETLFIGTIHDISARIEQEKKIKELARFPEENWNPVLKISAQGEITYVAIDGEGHPMPVSAGP